MTSLKSSSLIYIGAAALNALVPFVVLPMLARWLGPEDFGVVGNYLALVNLATVVAGLSVHGIVSVVHFKQHPSEVPSYVMGALRVVAATGVPLVGVLLLAGAPLSRITAVPAAWLWTAGLAAIGQFVVSLALAVFQTRQQAWRYGALQVGLAIGWGALSLFFIGVLRWGWEGRAVGQLLAVATVAGFALMWMRRAGVLAARQRSAPLSALLRFGVPLLPHSLAAAVMAGADRLVLTALGSAEVTGQYFAAFQISAVLTVAAAAMNQAWVPWLYTRLAKHDPAQSRAVVRATYGIYAMLLAGALVLAVAAPWLVPLIAGGQYVASVGLLKWLAPAAALSGMYYFVTNYLFYAGRTGLLSGITVACSLFQLLLMALFVPRWGAQGAAAAVLSTALVYWLATWVAAQRVFPMPWRLGAQACAS